MYSKLTAANLFLSRDNRIGQDCFQYRRKKLDEKRKKVIEKVRLAKAEWQQCKVEAQKIEQLLTETKKRSRI